MLKYIHSYKAADVSACARIVCCHPLDCARIRCVSSEERHDGVRVTDFAYAANVSDLVPNPYSGSKITSSNASRARRQFVSPWFVLSLFDKFERRNAKKFDGLLCG